MCVTSEYVDVVCRRIWAMSDMLIISKQHQTPPTTLTTIITWNTQLITSGRQHVWKWANGQRVLTFVLFSNPEPHDKPYDVTHCILSAGFSITECSFRGNVCVAQPLLIVTRSRWGDMGQAIYSKQRQMISTMSVSFEDCEMKKVPFAPTSKVCWIMMFFTADS